MRGAFRVLKKNSIHKLSYTQNQPINQWRHCYDIVLAGELALHINAGSGCIQLFKQKKKFIGFGSFMAFR